jgi:hypothetical protein
MQNAGRLKQMRMVAGLVNQQNRKALPITFGSALGIMLVLTLVAVFTGQWYLIAFAVLQSMRGNWTVTPAVNANRNMDVVHRAVGRAGVVLVGEGMPSRVAGLLANEKRKTSRVAHEVPIYDFQVGDDEGQIPVSKLQKKIMRLPRDLKGPQVADLNFRLKALPQSLQAPKGPMPRGGRQPKMPRPRAR